jgi:hypothetical protein
MNKKYYKYKKKYLELKYKLYGSEGGGNCRDYDSKFLGTSLQQMIREDYFIKKYNIGFNIQIIDDSDRILIPKPITGLYFNTAYPDPKKIRINKENLGFLYSSFVNFNRKCDEEKKISNLILPQGVKMYKGVSKSRLKNINREEILWVGTQQVALIYCTNDNNEIKPTHKLAKFRTKKELKLLDIFDRTNILFLIDGINKLNLSDIESIIIGIIKNNDSTDGQFEEVQTQLKNNQITIDDVKKSLIGIVYIVLGLIPINSLMGINNCFLNKELISQIRDDMHAYNYEFVYTDQTNQTSQAFSEPIIITKENYQLTNTVTTDDLMSFKRLSVKNWDIVFVEILKNVFKEHDGYFGDTSILIYGHIFHNEACFFDWKKCLILETPQDVLSDVLDCFSGIYNLFTPPLSEGGRETAVAGQRIIDVMSQVKSPIKGAYPQEIPISVTTDESEILAKYEAKDNDKILKKYETEINKIKIRIDQLPFSTPNEKFNNIELILNEFEPKMKFDLSPLQRSSDPRDGIIEINDLQDYYKNYIISLFKSICFNILFKQGRSVVFKKYEKIE